MALTQLLDEHSRLIAVSSNLREVTVFAHGYAALPDLGGEEPPISYEGIIPGVRNQKFAQFISGDITRHRHHNCRCWSKILSSFRSKALSYVG